MKISIETDDGMVITAEVEDALAAAHLLIELSKAQIQCVRWEAMHEAKREGKGPRRRAH